MADLIITEDTNELVFTVTTLTGVVNFNELFDVPSSYTGHAGEIVVVNADEDGLEFTSSPTVVDWDEIGGDQTDISLGGFTNDLDTDDIPEGETNLYYTDTRVRAAVTNASPITYAEETGTFGLSYNTENLTEGDGGLDTIQDINTTSSPTFAGLTVGSTSAILKRVEGVLTDTVADTDYQRVVTWNDGLVYSEGIANIDYNTTNLQITDSKINTIQNISTTSSPTFTGLTLTTIKPNADGAAAITIDDADGTDVVTIDTVTPAVNVYADLNIYGDITQEGSSYETHAEQVYSKDDLIITRDGAIAGLDVGEYTGIQAHLYDGVNDGQLVFDKDGWARVGDVGDLQKLATIEETSQSGGVAFYDTTDFQLKTNTNLTWDDVNKRLGIGTTSPTAPLHVNNVGYGKAIASFETAGRVLTIGAQSGYVYMGYGNREQFKIAAHSGNGMFSFGSGTLDGVNTLQVHGTSTFDNNVGIGTTSPTYALDVNRSNHNVARFTSTGTNTGADVLIVDADSSSGRASLQIQSNGGSREVFFAGANGNVGIGTASPNYNLEVSGSSATAYSAFAITNTSTDAGAYINQDFRLAGNDAVTNTAGYVLVGKEQLWTSTASTRDSYMAFYTRLNNTLAEKMRITSAGYVGIGTTSPTKTLHVEKEVDGDLIAQFYNSHTTNGYGVLINTNTTDGTNYALRVKSASKEILTGLNNGNVGIGTTSPSHLLTVNGITKTTDINIGERVVFASDRVNYFLGGTINSTKGIIGHSFYGWTLEGDSGVGLRITDSGRVGIGTTSPSTLLHLNSVAPIIQLTHSTTGAYNRITTGDGVLELIADAGNASASSNIRFSVDNLEKMRINSDGNVGIGTTTPTQKLEVGDITSRNVIRVNGLSTADMAPIYSIFRSGSAEWITTSAGASNNNFIIGANPASYSDANLLASAKILIKTSGYVGIGTDAPAGQLHVYNNTADATTTLTVNKNNASATGNIVDFQFGGTSKASVSYGGQISTVSNFKTPNGMINDVSSNNSYVNVSSTGTTISRNVADANTALIVNQQHASSTGRIVDFQFNGTAKAYINKDGTLYLPEIANTASGANAYIQLLSTGNVLSRNVADANPSLRVNQVHASSTGDILQLEWQTIDRFNVAYDGTTTLSNNKWLRAKDYAGTGYVNLFKVNASNEIDVGGTLNIGTLSLSEDSGLTSMINLPVSATPSDGTQEAYTFNIDSDVVLKVHALADGSGGVDNKAVIIATEDLEVPDTSLSNGQTTFYLDETSNTLVVKCKYSDGTVKTGTVALT